MKNRRLLILAIALTLAGCSKQQETAAPVPAPSANPAPSIPTAAAPAVPAQADPTATIIPQPAALTIPPIPAAPIPAAPAPAAADTVKTPSIPTIADLSSDQVASGLKEALANGLQTAVAQLGKTGGFLNNPDVKIPMPSELQSVEKALRAVGQGALADQFVTTMNQAAEQAVPAAASVFTDALKGMTVDDAKKILTGPDDAATQYFRTATEAQLTQKFLPIVKQATAASGATAAYKQVTDKAKAINPFSSTPSLDLDNYVTGKALDGLFKMVAQEEKQIRQNPAAQTSSLLQSVFGALKK